VSDHASHYYHYRAEHSDVLGLLLVFGGNLLICVSLVDTPTSMPRNAIHPEVVGHLDGHLDAEAEACTP
tara:strand:+ start:725 stop:931 length:207 start_codon:yes stop_codon:yes gene_type:complete